MQENLRVVGIGKLGQGREALVEELKRYARQGYKIKRVWLHPSGQGNDKLFEKEVLGKKPGRVVLHDIAKPLISPCWFAKLKACNIAVLELNGRREPKKLSSTELDFLALQPITTRPP